MLMVQRKRVEYRLSGVQSIQSSSSFEIEGIFRENALKWYEETKYLSSVSDIVLHPSYQRIIGLGPAALPLLFRERAETHGHWFWALTAITGVDPVPEDDHGRIRAMTARWLEWAKEQGYIW